MGVQWQSDCIPLFYFVLLIGLDTIATDTIAYSHNNYQVFNKHDAANSENSYLHLSDF